MGSLLQIAIWVGIIILCAGLVCWANLYFGNRYRKSGQDRAAEDRAEQRLYEIDRRLIEVQAVMIALSEKFDRFEERDQRKNFEWRDEGMELFLVIGNSFNCFGRGLAKSDYRSCEKRLSDIQVVVLSIDEKFEKGGCL